MQYITRYQKDNDGTYSIVATGVELEQRHIDLLENGYPLKADVEVPDHEKITHKQRRTIFLLCEDIELHLGQPKEAMRQDFQFELEIMNGYDPISLKNCSKKIATELIEMIIAFMFHHQVPMRLEASKLMKEDKSYLYWATINRNCVICGKPHADLAHYEAVGRGMNRNKMNHYDKHVLALCRQHHNEQHAIGVKSFDDKYHLHDSWIKVDERLNKMLKGEKNE
ncbi:putative HNHc nuclease [Staphylococcus aureus]|uniref:putative HNHc nuclease n=1 Tax=Staphylococcus aureus TaxID=1280 RepID=UPI000DFD16EF|nr:putative HNHc nuclease [Staphylococcus aureus]SUJ94794.1 phi PV83 orf 19-like protein [Staphylococcus aureus]SUK06780.1 phi PV83 orf 19-like protein [Staphylococcus aureus]